MYDITGKIALVTGGAEGIGLNCVKELLRNGVKGVAIVDINATQESEVAKQLVNEFGSDRVIFAKADVTKDDEFEAAFRSTIIKWKTVDIVVNNAGVLHDAKWEFEISINCGGVVRGTLLGLQYMGKDKGGKGGVIVNLASILGLQALPSCPVYTASKHFVVGLGRSLGTTYHYARTGVKIITMCPGLTNTSMPINGSKFALTSLAPDIGQLLIADFAKLDSQPTENVAKGMVTCITTGDNGSIWVSEDNQPAYEVEIPIRIGLAKK